MAALLPTHEIGSLKKPLWLVNILRDKRVPREEKQKARDDASYLNLRILEEVGLDIVYDGEARRVEMYEYPVRNIGGFKFAGRVRSWDNRYFKKARCISEVEYKTTYHLEEFSFLKERARKPLKIPVTGAYTLADWSYNEYYPSKEEFVVALAQKVVRPLLKGLVEAGAEHIQIDEPAATTHQDEMGIFAESFNKSVQGVSGNIGVHICYSGDNYTSLLPHLLEIKASHYALEFANRDSWQTGVSAEARSGYSSLRLFKEYGGAKIGVGVLDVHRDDVEPPSLVRDRLVYAARALGDPGLVLANPDCGLRTRSRDIAFRKLKAMVEGTELARRVLA